MYFLRSWLEDYIDLSKVTNTHLEQLITDKIAEVDELIETNNYFDDKVLIGRIQNVVIHPDADKLKIFQVNLGQNKPSVQIVSAAENVREGMLVPVALIGARLPFLTIAPRKLRGVESQGMCCGKSELMLEDESKGLWELEKDLDAIIDYDLILGKPLYEFLNQYFQNETIIDIKVLPDKMSQIGNHLGMSLELAIALENYDLLTELAQNLLNPDYIDSTYPSFLAENNKNTEQTNKIDFSDQTGNYANQFNLYSLELEKNYILTHLLQKRMFLTGRNLVGNVADLSNYLLADIGQPSHFFDADKL